jgi:hypothetical protein
MNVIGIYIASLTKVSVLFHDYINKYIYLGSFSLVTGSYQLYLKRIFPLLPLTTLTINNQLVTRGFFLDEKTFLAGVNGR